MNVLITSQHSETVAMSRLYTASAACVNCVLDSQRCCTLHISAVTVMHVLQLVMLSSLFVSQPLLIYIYRIYHPVSMKRHRQLIAEISFRVVCWPRLQYNHTNSSTTTEH